MEEKASESQLIQKILFGSDQTLFSVADVLLAMTVSTLLVFVLIVTYRRSHGSATYSAPFVVSLFCMAVCTSVVMMIIGSNIARAFSLVGALSIIRFRTAIKDPRDITYLFASMVIGMACGTHFYAAGIAMTLFLFTLMSTLERLAHSFRPPLDRMFRITYKPDAETETYISGVLDAHFARVDERNRITFTEDGSTTVVFAVVPRRGFDHLKLKADLEKNGQVTQFATYMGGDARSAD